MTRGFAEKLRLIMRVTGCVTQKALYAKLKSINAGTGYDPVRAYKWIQGRSNPRDPEVYEDLARLLQIGIGGDELRRCSYAEFRHRLSAHYGDVMPEDAGSLAHGPSRPAPAPHAMPPPDYLAGRYLTLSRAWSPHNPDSLIWGVTTLTRHASGTMSADYVESLPWGDLVLSGDLLRLGRNLFAPLASADKEVVFSVIYALPSPPGVVLGGVVGGVTAYDAEMRPVAGRIVSLRLPEEVVPRVTSAAYLPGDPDLVAERMTAFGFGASQAARLAPEVVDFITAPGDGGLVEARIHSLNRMVGKYHEAAMTP